MIPIKYRACEVPDILRYIAMLDYIREDTKPWFWHRVAASLRTASAPPHSSSAILYPFVGGLPGYPQIAQINGLFKRVLNYGYVKFIITVEELASYDDQLFYKATYDN